MVAFAGNLPGLRAAGRGCYLWPGGRATEASSRCRTVASSVAARRPSSSCLIRNALAVIPNRDSSASFTGATADTSTAPVPSPSA